MYLFIAYLIHRESLWDRPPIGYEHLTPMQYKAMRGKTVTWYIKHKEECFIRYNYHWGIGCKMFRCTITYKVDLFGPPKWKFSLSCCVEDQWTAFCATRDWFFNGHIFVAAFTIISFIFFYKQFLIWIISQKNKMLFGSVLMLLYAIIKPYPFYKLK